MKSTVPVSAYLAMVGCLAFGWGTGFLLPRSAFGEAGPGSVACFGALLAVGSLAALWWPQAARNEAP